LVTVPATDFSDPETIIDVEHDRLTSESLFAFNSPATASAFVMSVAGRVSPSPLFNSLMLLESTLQGVDDNVARSASALPRSTVGTKSPAPETNGEVAETLPTESVVMHANMLPIVRSVL
jgi:hypothetical protein